MMGSTNSDLLNLVVLLIEEKMGRYTRQVDWTTCLEKDLGISGDDAVELLIAFSKKFDVDMSAFDMRHFFYPEGDPILPGIIRFFKGEKNIKKYELTLAHLEKALITGKLTNEVPVAENKIKQTLNHRGMQIRSYDLWPPETLPAESLSNIIAVDPVGNIIWRAEAPTSRYDQYCNIRLGIYSNMLIAMSSLSFRYLIDLGNGKIISYSLVK